MRFASFIYKSLIVYVAILSNAGNVFAQTEDSDEVSAESFQRVAELIERFEHNRTKVKRFTVAMHEEFVFEPIRTRDSEFVVENWYIHSEDVIKGLRRSDEIISRRARDQAGKDYVSAGLPRTTVVRKDLELYSMLPGKVGPLVRLNKITKEDMSKLMLYTCFDPWELVLNDYEVLDPIQTTRQKERGEYFDLTKVKGVEFEEKVTKVKFGLTDDIYLLLSFADVAEEMPVSVDLISDEENYNGTMRSLRIDWKKHDGVWFPVEFLSVRRRGNPSKPVAIMTSTFSAYWLLNDDFPAAVFEVEQGKQLGTIDLRDKILSHSTLGPN